MNLFKRKKQDNYFNINKMITEKLPKNYVNIELTFQKQMLKNDNISNTCLDEHNIEDFTNQSFKENVLSKYPSAIIKSITIWDREAFRKIYHLEPQENESKEPTYRSTITFWLNVEDYNKILNKFFNDKNTK